MQSQKLTLFHVMLNCIYKKTRNNGNFLEFSVSSVRNMQSCNFSWTCSQTGRHAPVNSRRQVIDKQGSLKNHQHVNRIVQFNPCLTANCYFHLCPLLIDQETSLTLMGGGECIEVHVNLNNPLSKNYKQCPDFKKNSVEAISIFYQFCRNYHKNLFASRH